jgi:ATP-dependent DNA helicase RecG
MPVGADVTVLAEVIEIKESLTGGGRGLSKVTVRDSAGQTYEVPFWGTVKGGTRVLSPAAGLHRGDIAVFSATVGAYRRQPQLERASYEVLGAMADVEAVKGKMIPVYPATANLRGFAIRKTILTFLEIVTPDDPFPSELRAARGLLDLPTALRWIHRPEDYEQVGAARKRLKWDEAFAVQLSLVQRKKRAESVSAAARPVRAGGILSTFDSSLPYELTDGQRAVGERIAADLAGAHPMHRLLQGEVGSGKTVVALRAMLQVVDAGAQAALLAPTEVLATQHYRSIRELLGPLGRAGELDGAPEATAVALLTGSQSTAARREALAAVADRRAGIVIGTHALLYDPVSFADLGLVVIDEQHRFGVEQRDALRAKATDQPPHVLVMTATPIPRTVAMTVFGDLETSELTELPRGRSPITTHAVPAAEKPAFLARAWDRIREEVGKGHQAYVVCPRIGGDHAEDDAAPPPTHPEDGDDKTPPRRAIALLEVAPLLEAGELAGLRVGVLHGRLPAEEKDRVMRDFAAGRVDVLLATTVIEVGVDVANATMMVILDADRFGMAQLHQLRGRVGRGTAPALCLLVTEAEPGSAARDRLDAVASTVDGFRLARLDLELRREGDVLGEAQSGISRHLRMLSLVRDEELIGEARQEAESLIDQDPELAGHPGLAAAVAAVVDQERAEFLEKG